MKFSIIIPVYNVENYIEECIESVIVQTFTDYEVILVDDGSTDLSGVICDKYAQQYSCFHVIHQKNRGLSAARNCGIEMAVGEYLLFLDSDDYYAHEKCLEIISQKADGCDIVAYDWIIKNENVYKAEQQVCKLNANYKDGVQYLLSALQNTPLYRWYVCIYAIRREYWIQQKFHFVQGIAFEDIKITYSILLFSAEVHVIPDALYVYRYGRNGSITETVKFSSLIDKLEVVQSNITNIQQNSTVPNELKKLLCNNFALSYCSVIEQYRSVDAKERERVLKKLKQYQWVGQYLTGFASKSLIQLVKLLGFSFASWLLYIRRQIKKLRA